ALHNGVATTLATSTVGGNLRVTSDSSLAEAGVLTVNGTSFFAAATTIDLSSSANQLVGSVTLSSGGNSTLLNGVPTTIAGATVGGDLSVTTTGPGSNLILAGNVSASGHTVTLTSAETINQGLGVITAGILAGSSGGATSLT